MDVMTDVGHLNNFHQWYKLRAFSDNGTHVRGEKPEGYSEFGILELGMNYPN
jgi:hypothetical protein